MSEQSTMMKDHITIEGRDAFPIAGQPEVIGANGIPLGLLPGCS
jgi:hypothetical protein